MIDKTLSAEATFEDGILLKAINPVGTMLRNYIGSKWKLKKVPFIGTIISDSAMLREVLKNKELFSEDLKESTPSFWNLLIGGEDILGANEEDRMKLEKLVDDTFSTQHLESVIKSHINPVLNTATESLLNDERLDIVEITEEATYLLLWHGLGLSEKKLLGLDFKLAVKNLRAVTDGLNPSTVKFSADQIGTALGRIVFLEEVIRDDYHNSQESFPFKLKVAGYSETEAVDITKSFFFTSADVAIRFLPRMVALFIKSRYIDHLETCPQHLTYGIEEALRVTVPVPVSARRVTSNTTLHGIPLKTGETVILSTVVASRRFGDFDPFSEIDDDVRSVWTTVGLQTQTGIKVSKALGCALGSMLTEVNNADKLAIFTQASDDKAHPGSYKELVISNGKADEDESLED